MLFQDVDVVWFKPPLEYIDLFHTERLAKNQSIPDAYFSDDGQRTLRFTPFYANSGIT
jgi:hypothetical protein